MFKKFVFSFLFLVAFSAIAGEYKTIKDDFENTSKTLYMSTMSEIMDADAKAYIAISRLQNQSKVLLSIVSLDDKDYLECNKRAPRLKTYDNQIHRIDAKRVDLKICMAIIDLNLIKNKFSIKVPVVREPDFVIEMDTRNLDMSRLTIEKVN